MWITKEKEDIVFFQQKPTKNFVDKPLLKTDFTDLCVQIKRLLTIEEVVKYYINIKKKGKYYICCCPFHKERTPSFFVNPSLGFFKCFGCGASGDIFSFVENYDNISFVETVALFSERYPKVSSLCLSLLEKKNENIEVFEKKKRACEAIKKIQNFFSSSLFGENSAEAVRFLQERGVDKEKASLFGIGFCPSFSSFFLSNKNYGEEMSVMDELGIVHNYDGRKKVPFEERISFPFFDSLGNVVGFSWRSLSGNEERLFGSKYINSAESFLFKKGEVLFGFFQAKGEIKEKRKCFIVEGFFDAITMFSAGYKNTVAVSGTALSREQCFLLKKTADCVSLFFDNDNAGERATIRAIQQCLKEGFMVNVVRIKGKEKDPDEFLRGKEPEEAVREVKSMEEDFVTFLYRFFFDSSEGLQGKTRAINKVKAFLALINDHVYKTLAFKKLSSLCGVAFHDLQQGCFVCTEKKEEKEKKSTIEKYEEEVLILFFKILFFWKKEYAGDFERIMGEIGEASFLSADKRELLFLFLNTFRKDGKLETEVLNEIKDTGLRERIIGVFFECGKGEEVQDEYRKPLVETEEVKREDEDLPLLRLLYENILFLKIKKIQVFIAEEKEKLKKCVETEAGIILDKIEKLKNEEREISKVLKINIF